MLNYQNTGFLNFVQYFLFEMKDALAPQNRTKFKQLTPLVFAYLAMVVSQISLTLMHAMAYRDVPHSFDMSSRWLRMDAAGTVLIQAIVIQIRS